MKKNHLVKLSSLALLFAFFALTSCATAPKPSYLDPIRWWDQGQQDPIKELAIETPEQLAARVPKRTDPKIVLLMYHNIVFGRTGGEYNRDLYNFEHDLVFLRNRTQIIGLDELPGIQSGKKKLDTDASIITFDDGDLSIYAVVFPLLKQYDIKATFLSSLILWEPPAMSAGTSSSKCRIIATQRAKSCSLSARTRSITNASTKFQQTKSRGSFQNRNWR
jgi:Predicted xylanase/chitin deacetylase